MAIKVTVNLHSPIFQAGALTRKLTEVVDRTAKSVEGGVKLRIKQGAKTGRLYRRASIKKAVGAQRAAEFGRLGLRRSRIKPGAFVTGYEIHRASAPGESPADDTGFLANSIQATPAQVDETGVRAAVRVGAKYGRRLEKKLNRPYLRPVIEQARPQFIAEVKQAVKELT